MVSRMYHRCKKKSLILYLFRLLTPRSSTCLLRNTKPGIPLHIKRLIDFTDLFGSVELIFRYLIMINL